MLYSMHRMGLYGNMSYALRRISAVLQAEFSNKQEAQVCWHRKYKCTGTRRMNLLVMPGVKAGKGSGKREIKCYQGWIKVNCTEPLVYKFILNKSSLISLSAIMFNAVGKHAQHCAGALFSLPFQKSIERFVGFRDSLRV